MLPYLRKRRMMTLLSHVVFDVQDCLDRQSHWVRSGCGVFACSSTILIDRVASPPWNWVPERSRWLTGVTVARSPSGRLDGELRRRRQTCSPHVLLGKEFEGVIVEVRSTARVTACRRAISILLSAQFPVALLVRFLLFRRVWRHDGVQTLW